MQQVAFVQQVQHPEVVGGSLLSKPNQYSARNSKAFYRALRVLACFAATASAATAQSYTTLASFDGADGGRPTAELVQGTDGNLYGTTSNFGNNACGNGCGTVFKITADGVLTTLHSFDGPDGGQLIGGLFQGTDGNFYGTTEEGGDPVCVDSLGCGTVFKITADGTLTTLHKFNGKDGYFPYASLIEGTDGNFYGTTSAQGSFNGGTVFKITSAGIFTTLHTFVCTRTACPEGSSPSAALVQGIDGNFYGTTYGGLGGGGTIFKVTPGGELTTLHTFDGTDGSLVQGAMVQGHDGNFYGVTRAGGAGGLSTGQHCADPQFGGCGTLFKISPKGEFTTFYNFCSQDNCADGYEPQGGLVQGTNGNFYGTTGSGGVTFGGTIFKITIGGILTTLHSLDDTGYEPTATLLQSTNGDLYGTTYEGGANDSGTVFRLSVGLRSFIETQPQSGGVGTHVILRGNNLTGATAVSFGSTPAEFTVVSDSEITTRVPPGSTKGKVRVPTSSGALTSNVDFRVMPTILDFSPRSGSVGTTIVITGKTLNGTGWVSFGGVPATSFTVNSYTQINATVPAGAKSGEIAITAPSGTVRSSSGFKVTP